MMKLFSANSKLVIFPLLLLFFIPALAYAEDGRQNNTAVTMGWFAVGSGLVANLSFVAFKIVKKIPIIRLVGGYENTRSLTPLYGPILNFHIILNSIGFSAGLVHGFMLLRGLDYISLSLVIVMIISMISGIILKYSSGRNMKFFGRLVHGQFVLAALLITLVTLHIFTAGVR
ncbi:MAG: hypothetical protein ACYC6W_03710 [Nitrosotalea sp.]